MTIRESEKLPFQGKKNFQVEDLVEWFKAGQHAFNTGRFESPVPAFLELYPLQSPNHPTQNSYSTELSIFITAFLDAKDAAAQK